MDDLPVGDPKYSHIKASYYPVHRPTNEPPDRALHDFLAVGVGILVLVIVWALATITAVPAR